MNNCSITGQVGAAVRPAFAEDTPSHVTAAACDVCSAWIGSGVARDLSDLRRVYQLLVTSLTKLKPRQQTAAGSSQQQHVILYNESALTLEKLSILKAWAEVYTVSMKDETHIRSKVPTTPKEEEEVKGEDVEEDDDDDFGDFEANNSGTQVEEEKEDSSDSLTSPDGGSLGRLVQAELSSLSKYWLAALRDHALLTLPSEFKNQLPFDGGAFYSNDTAESARKHYKATWTPILEAAAVWLTYGGGFDNMAESEEVEEADEAANAAVKSSPEDVSRDRFHLLLGVCVEALSNTRSASDLTKDQVLGCLKSLAALLDSPWARQEVKQLASSKKI